MPKIVSRAQYRTMQAAAHSPAFARKVGIKPAVAQSGIDEVDVGLEELPERASDRRKHHGKLR